MEEIFDELAHVSEASADTKDDMPTEAGQAAELVLEIIHVHDLTLAEIREGLSIDCSDKQVMSAICFWMDTGVVLQKGCKYGLVSRYTGQSSRPREKKPRENDRYSKVNGKVMDRVYDILTEDNEMTFGSIFGSMEPPWKKSEVRAAISAWIDIGVLQKIGDCYRQTQM